MSKEEDQEKQDMYVANCVSCTLADSMKTCNVCTFRIGLAVRKIHHETLKMTGDPVAQERLWEMVPGNIWEAYWHYAFADYYKRGEFRKYPNNMVVFE